MRSTPDDDRFAAETEPFRRELLAHCYRMVGSAHDAEDLVQDTMSRAYAGFHSFRDGTNHAAWLFRILHNTWISEHRKTKRRHVEVSIDHLTDQRPRAAPAGTLHQSMLLGGDANRIELSSGSRVSRRCKETYEFTYRLNDKWALVGDYDEYDEYNAGVKWRAYVQEGDKSEKK